MTNEEIQMAMDSHFYGAARVRAKKHAQKISKNLHRQLSSRIINQMWDEEKQNWNVA